MKTLTALTVAAFTLAGCVGNGSDGDGGGGAPGPTSLDIGTLPSGFVATYDDVNAEVVLTIDGVEVARLPEDDSDGSFALYSNGDASALYAPTISGDGTVFVVQSETGELGLAGVQVARLGDTVLPSTGSATFDGDYAGFLVDATDLSSVDTIAGDALLTADFAGASISGSITNRSMGPTSPDDIMLLSTAITAAGDFSGTTTGGDIDFFGTASDGTYAGLFVGATGNEVVGGLSITHTGLGGTFLEIGGFVAAED